MGIRSFIVFLGPSSSSSMDFERRLKRLDKIEQGLCGIPPFEQLDIVCGWEQGVCGCE